MKAIEMDLDQPLHFDDNLPSTEPVRIRNALLIDGHVCDDIDAVTAYAASERTVAARFGEFGTGGGHKAKTYSRSVMGQLHHNQEYCPCKRLTSEEITNLGYEACDCGD